MPVVLGRAVFVPALALVPGIPAVPVRPVLVRPVLVRPVLVLVPGLGPEAGLGQPGEGIQARVRSR